MQLNAYHAQEPLISTTFLVEDVWLVIPKLCVKPATAVSDLLAKAMLTLTT